MLRPSLLACVSFFAACGVPGAAGDGGYPADGGALIVVLSAFPAEGAAVLEHTTVERTQIFNDRTFRIGTLDGVPVAVGLTGMGLTNAAATSRAVLAALPVKGVVFSGVAGSQLRIADVVAPDTWTLRDAGTSYPADPQWLAAARTLIASGSVCLEHCTLTSSNQSVCLDHTPSATVGGTGESYEIQVMLPCQMNMDDVFACDVGTTMAQDQCQSMGPFSGDAGTGPITVDNETAAVAAEAAARGVPFIAFRGISDGADDPLNLPGYPTQFFAWYRLAARNAAATAAAFVAKVGAK